MSERVPTASLPRDHQHQLRGYSRNIPDKDVIQVAGLCRTSVECTRQVSSEMLDNDHAARFRSEVAMIYTYKSESYYASQLKTRTNLFSTSTANCSIVPFPSNVAGKASQNANVLAAHKVCASTNAIVSADAYAYQGRTRHLCELYRECSWTCQ
jgi:hypothetical protein